jgi:hypothetical protein
MKATFKLAMLACLLVTVLPGSPTTATERVIRFQCHTGMGASCIHHIHGAPNDQNSFVVYAQGEVDAKLAALETQLSQLRDQLSTANALIEQQRQTIEALSAGLATQISSLPTAVVTDEKSVTILRAQLQDGFDQRYLMKPSP